MPGKLQSPNKFVNCWLVIYNFFPPPSFLRGGFAFIIYPIRDSVLEVMQNLLVNIDYL
jgi:hypothetical protein